MTSDQPGGPGEPASPDRQDQALPSFPTSLGTSEGTTITLLGVTEDTGRFLAEVLQEAGPLPTDDEGWDALAERAVANSIYMTVDRNAEYIPPIPNGPDAT